MSRRRKPKALPIWRIYSVGAVLAVLPLMLVWRLVDLQLLDSEQGASFLQKQGAMRAIRSAEIPAYRGLITDRRGSPLAVSTPVVSLVANPQHLRDSNQLAALAAAMEISPDVLQQRIDQYADKQFMYLARHWTPEQARKVLALNLPGVHGEREYRRFYPAGEVAAQLVGVTNVDGKGIAGLEMAFDDWLQGTPGRKRYLKDLYGEAVRDIGVIKAAEPGNDLRLSIDLRLQYLQHRELQQAIADTGAVAGTAVTLDAWTGEVLAVSSYPVFNPNSRARKTTRNRALTDVFEPGSVMKSLTLVAALESGEYSLDTVIDTSPGRIRVGSKLLNDPINYGPITVSRVIEKSSQVGVIKIAQNIGHEPILDVFSRFGLGSPTNAGFPGERSGYLPNRERWSDIEKVTPAYGYGLDATLLQLAAAYSVFANEGRRMPLTFLEVDHRSLPEGERVIDPEIAAQVVKVLHRVTANEGTGTLAQVAGYQVGGKTGTVRKLGANGYLDTEHMALFVGIAPVERPRYVTAIMIDQPQGESHGGGSAAAPVYSRITEGVLRLRNEVPDLPVIDDSAQLAGLGGGQ
jgi:cell division protein FtsI (penicillin-binding protein 3)